MKQMLLVLLAVLSTSAHANSVTQTTSVVRAYSTDGFINGLRFDDYGDRFSLFDSSLGNLYAVKLDVAARGNVGFYISSNGIPTSGDWAGTLSRKGSTLIQLGRGFTYGLVSTSPASFEMTKQISGSGPIGGSVSLDGFGSTFCSIGQCGFDLSAFTTEPKFFPTDSRTQLSIAGEPDTSYVGSYPNIFGPIQYIRYYRQEFDLTLTYYYTPLSAVPEPATWAMIISGLGMIGGAFRLRRRQAQYA